MGSTASRETKGSSGSGLGSCQLSQTRVVAEGMVREGLSGYKAKSTNYMVPAFKEKTVLVEKTFSPLIHPSLT